MDSELIQRGRTHVERILLADGGELGLLGSNQAYQQVWARDSMLCDLGLWLTRNKEGRAIHARSLETLRRFQSPLGKIPHNVGMTGVSVRRPRLVVDLTVDGQRFSQQAEALVTVFTRGST